MTVVKICGLTNLEDARWAWRCGADLLGFILVPSSPRHVDAGTLAEIAAMLRGEGCRAGMVGVLAQGTDAEIRRIIAHCAPDYIQWHGTGYPGEVGAPVILAHRVADIVPWGAMRMSAAWAHLLDKYDPQRLGGTGQTLQWELLAEERDRPERLILAGGLTPDNVAQAIAIVHPWGVDVASGVESAPGRKDPDKVARFIENVRKVQP